MPSYLSPGDGTREVADILAELIVDQINRGGEKTSSGTQRRGSNRVLLKLLQALTDEERDSVSMKEKTVVKITEPPFNIQNLPGPPYLPTNYLPPNSLVTRPPSLRPPQSGFQTKFETESSNPPRFTETSLKKFNVETEKPFLTNMIKSLMSDFDKKNENNKYTISTDSPYQEKKYNRRKAFNPRPGGAQSVDIVVREQKTQRRPPVTPSVNNNRRPPSSLSSDGGDNGPFSRYPVRLPPQNTRNPHFSLPIDSLAGLVNTRPAQRISGRTGLGTDGENISFEEQLSKMMKELGKSNI